jgi:hypothetical protein
MRFVKRFALFWYDFVVGDDWTLAVAAVISISLTYFLAHRGWNAWPVLPVMFMITLGGSVWRVARTHRTHR